MPAADYLFCLFVAGDESNSRLAEQNLRVICLEYLPDRHCIEVVDVLEDFEAALEARVMVAPALIMSSPRRITLYGTLADKAKVLAALGLA